MFDKIREKIREYEASNSKDSQANSGKDSSSTPTSTSTYKCSQCGKTPLSGPVLYCDGCGQYMCYTCGVASGDMVWNCPNCAIEAHRVVL
jgi:membrane protease subunit (stomatin/prohibitin family)